MQSATKKSESTVPLAAARRSTAGAKKPKCSVILITRDDTLWPQVAAQLASEFILKQVDSIDELLTATPAGQAAIVLWDAREQTATAAVLSRLQLHSTCFAVVALDEAGNAQAWTNPIALRQIVAHVTLPVSADNLKHALENAQEEVAARTALLGEGGAPAPARAAAMSSPFGPKKSPWIPAAVIAGVLAAGTLAFLALQHKDGAAAPSPAPAATAVKPQPDSKAPAVADEKVDLMIEKAQQAMHDRHFIDPADGSALALYKSALLLDPNNGEAQQGLQRLAEILIARVQSALEERKIDVALQALESARSINPDDGRLTALDERIVSLRAEFGPAQILAAINAQNFDRASQLIDESARSKSLSGAKLNQLREELRRRREESDISNLVKLIDARLQQDKITEPRNDSAAFYLAQARAAGASPASVQQQSQEIFKRLIQVVHADIEQRHFGDADRLVAELHIYGVPAATIAGLQHDVNAARGQQAAAVPEQPQYLDLAQSRLSQGKVTEPDNDSALFYVNQLRATDPKNGSLARISSTVQAQILEQARAALDSNQPARADALLQMAAGLGASFELNALNQRLAQLKLASAAVPEVAEASLTRIRAVDLDYPSEALRKGIEGWVDLSYVVTTEGKVNTVKVLGSNPASVFEQAATRALSRVRYKPMIQGGKPISVSTKLRIAFRLSK